MKLAIGFLSNIPILNDLQNDTDSFIAFIDNAVNSFYDVKSQNYGSSVMHTSLILKELLGPNKNFKNKYIKYGIFMVNIVEATNSDEIKVAIESAVLPIGSSSVKRETNFNIAEVENFCLY